MHTFRRAPIVGFLTLAMAGCGGGGDSSSAALGTDGYEDLPISGDTASDLVGDALSGAGESTAGASSGALDDQSPRAPSLANALSLLSFSTEKVAPSELAADDNSGCSGGGTVSSSGTGSDVSLNFVDCVEDGQTANGRVALSVGEISANRISLTMRYIEFSLSGSGETLSLDGAVSLESTSAGASTEFRVSSDQLSLHSSLTGASAFSAMDMRTTLSGGQYSSTMAYVYGSDQIGGRISLSTPEPLVTAQSATWPATGVVRIEGAGDSWVEVDAGNGEADTAMLSVHDGSSTTSETVNWSDLDLDSLGQSAVFD